MTLRRSHAVRGFWAIVVAFAVVVACSGDDASQDDASQSDPPQATATAETAPDDAATVDSDSSAEPSDDAAGNEAASPTATDAPGPADDEPASVTDLAAGEQVEDTQGNLIAIYGVAEWPRSFGGLTDQAQARFPFSADVDGANDPTARLVALDIGMCSAGIDVDGLATGEFFVHESATDALSRDPLLDRRVVVRHPVVQPSFVFPSTAECVRGWLPVLSSQDDTPEIARYVLAHRPSSGARVETHVYQWELAPVDIEAADELFAAGQTVTFNEGALAETTVVLNGWAELVGQAAALDGTRMVGVSVELCPSSGTMPEFGLGVDGWNIVAPLESQGLLGTLGSAVTPPQCVDGWIEFAVPFGGTPTGFFATDGTTARSGYAEWSLADAAIATPE